VPPRHPSSGRPRPLVTPAFLLVVYRRDRRPVAAAPTLAFVAGVGDDDEHRDAPDARP
jgi:hypothetical protein